MVDEMVNEMRFMMSSLSVYLTIISFTISYHLPSHIIYHHLLISQSLILLGIGEYLSSKAENDFTRSEREREEW